MEDAPMGARDYWDRMLVYFGIAEEVDPELDERPASRRTNDWNTTDEWSSVDQPAPRRSAPRRSAPSRSAAPARVKQNSAGVGVVPPKTFNDAQVIADHIKAGLPVIVNLQQTDPDLAKRLIDFASGLTYGIDGDITRIADK